MKRIFASLFAIMIAMPALAQETGADDIEQNSGTSPSQSGGTSGLALRGDDGDAVILDGGEADEDTPEAAGQAEAIAQADDDEASPDDAAPEAETPNDDASQDEDAPPTGPAESDEAVAGDVADESSAVETPADESETDATAPDGSATDDMAADEPATDEAATDDMAVDESAADEPATDEPASADAVSDETVSDETVPDSEVPDGTDDAPADDAASETPEPDAPDNVITAAAPFLSSTDYLAVRPDSTSEALELVWQVETFTPDGQRIGAAETRTLIMAPDFVRYERPGAIDIYDFVSNRHLELDIAASTLTNSAFEGEVRRRLDTYLGLSQAGRLEQIPLGPDRSFDRFWLESAMGIRREPVELEARFEAGEFTVERGTGPSLLSARFDIETEDSGEVATEEETDAAETADSDSAGTPLTSADAIAAMAAPIDLSSGESVVFDPSQAAAPISLEDESPGFSWPAASPEQQAQAELFRRWMRHALPLHPDVLAALRGAPEIPEQFAYFIISPDSPEGRREIWTLTQTDTLAAGFRLEPDLTAQAGSSEILGQVLNIAADAATGTAPDDADLLEAIESYRTAGDPARAYLVAFHETSRNGPCPPPGQAERREACAASNSVVASGLGNPAFETVFGAIDEIGGENGETILEALSPYLEEDGYVGAAARTILANELLAWATRDPDGPPADIDPFELLVQAIAIDPHAGAIYRYLGNALLNVRNPVGAWTVYDAGRAVPGAADNALLVQLSALEERLRGLAPDFFLPR